MNKGARYVEIPAAALLSELRSIGKAIEGKGGKASEGTQGREVIFDFTPPGDRGTVRVYTSLANGAATARDCGKDAVRLIVGIANGKKFRTLAEPRKMLRTAPQNLEQHERVRVFLDRLTEALRGAYKTAATTPKCPKCSSLMAARTSKGTGQQFYGCLNFPECRGTRPKNN